MRSAAYIKYLTKRGPSDGDSPFITALLKMKKEGELDGLKGDAALLKVVERVQEEKKNPQQIIKQAQDEYGEYEDVRTLR